MDRSNVVLAAAAALVLLASIGAPPAGAVPYEDLILADNPHFYLRLNETSGTTAFDASPNSLDGSYHQFGGDQPVLLGAAGIPGGGAGNTAAEFTGPTRISQVYVADPANPTAYTIEAWFRADPGATTSRGILTRTAGDPFTTWSHQLLEYVGQRRNPGTQGNS